jgi:hypothetical protein
MNYNEIYLKILIAVVALVALYFLTDTDKPDSSNPG